MRMISYRVYSESYEDRRCHEGCVWCLVLGVVFVVLSCWRLTPAELRGHLSLKLA